MQHQQHQQRRFCSIGFGSPTPSMGTPGLSQSPPLSPFIPPSPSPPIFSQALSPFPTLTPTAQHIVPPTYEGQIGPLWSQRRGLRPDDPVLPSMNVVDAEPGNCRFQFHARNFWLTWSRIHEQPNQLLEDFMAAPPATIECKYMFGFVLFNQC